MSAERSLNAAGRVRDTEAAWAVLDGAGLDPRGLARDVAGHRMSVSPRARKPPEAR